MVTLPTSTDCASPSRLGSTCRTEKGRDVISGLSPRAPSKYRSARHNIPSCTTPRASLHPSISTDCPRASCSLHNALQIHHTAMSGADTITEYHCGLQPSLPALGALRGWGSAAQILCLLQVNLTSHGLLMSSCVHPEERLGY